VETEVEVEVAPAVGVGVRGAARATEAARKVARIVWVACMISFF
jgi:hypothetical protein